MSSEPKFNDWINALVIYSENRKIHFSPTVNHVDFQYSPLFLNIIVTQKRYSINQG